MKNFNDLGEWDICECALAMYLPAKSSLFTISTQNISSDFWAREVWFDEVTRRKGGSILVRSVFLIISLGIDWNWCSYAEKNDYCLLALQFGMICTISITRLTAKEPDNAWRESIRFVDIKFDPTCAKTLRGSRNVAEKKVIKIHRISDFPYSWMSTVMTWNLKALELALRVEPETCWKVGWGVEVCT